MPAIAETTHVVIPNTLIVYRRERSNIWQCRYKVDGLWQRASTKQRDVAKATIASKELLIEAEIRKRQNLPVVTRKFRDVARLAIERMEDEQKSGKGKVSYSDYIRVIKEHLIPCLGKRSITSIDYDALNELDAWRITLMGKAPSQSTTLTQNAALNRVFDEGVIRGFLTDANRPKLESKGRHSDRRPSFELEEVRALLAGFDSWIERGKNDWSKECRTILRDYVMLLLDTGARPGKELMNLKWKQIKFSFAPTETPTGQTEIIDGVEEETVLTNLNRTVEMTVSGKTGTRQIIGRQPTVKVLEIIARRNYDINNPVIDPFKSVITPKNNDFVLRTKDEKIDVSGSFQKMLERYLEEHNLLIDPKTEQHRVFYSLRHTYATLALTHDKVPIHTLAKQMGTSVLMIEKHYSHLKVVQAIEQLRGEESRQLIDAGGVIDEAYKSTKAVKEKKTKKVKTARQKDGE